MEIQGATVVITHHILEVKQKQYKYWLNEIDPVLRLSKNKMKYYFLLMLLSFLTNGISQEKFKIRTEETANWKSIYYLINKKGETIKQLDSTKYLFSFNGYRYKSFAIFNIKGESGWCAIDSNEKILFKVYNTSFGEPSPDELVENKIRIVDENNKIGFADSSGKIIIKPQFEIASSFNKGKAMIGESCEKIPWNQHAKEDDCHHYSIVCKKHGYINKKGEILLLGDFSFEEIQQKIKWKSAKP